MILFVSKANPLLTLSIYTQLRSLSSIVVDYFGIFWGDEIPLGNRGYSTDDERDSYSEFREG